MSNTIPADWKKNKFENLFNIAIGGTPSRNEPLFWDAECKTGNYWVSIRDLKGRIISQTAEQITDLGIKKSNVKLVPKGTVIMSFKLSVGRVAFAGRDLYTNEAIAAFQPINEKAIDLQYFYQGLHSWDLLGDIDQAVKGVTLNKEKLRNIEAILPPLPEQQKIAAILTSVDDVIEKTQAQIDKLKDLKSGMMQELLTKGVGIKQGDKYEPHTEFKDSPVGKIPKIWEVLDLDDVASVVDSMHQTPTFSDVGMPMVRVTEIRQNDILDISGAMLVNAKTFNAFSKNYKPNVGDILIARVGAYFGATAYISLEHEFCLGQNTASIRPNTILSQFLFICLNSENVRSQMNDAVAVGAQPSLSLKAIKELKIVIPSHQEQKVISGSINSVSKRVSMAQKKLQQLKNTKKALMQDLLTGKVRVKVAEQV